MKSEPLAVDNEITLQLKGSQIKQLHEPSKYWSLILVHHIFNHDFVSELWKNKSLRAKPLNYPAY